MSLTQKVHSSDASRVVSCPIKCKNFENDSVAIWCAEAKNFELLWRLWIRNGNMNYGNFAKRLRIEVFQFEIFYKIFVRIRQNRSYNTLKTINGTKRKLYKCILFQLTTQICNYIFSLYLNMFEYIGKYVRSLQICSAKMSCSTRMPKSALSTSKLQGKW